MGPPRIRTPEEVQQTFIDGLEYYAHVARTPAESIRAGLEDRFIRHDPAHERPLPGSEAQFRMGGALLRAARLFDDKGEIPSDPVAAFNDHLESSDPAVISDRLIHLFGNEAVRATNNRERFVFAVAQMEANDILRHLDEVLTLLPSTMGDLKTIGNMIKDPETRRNGMALLHLFYLSNILDVYKYTRECHYTDFLSMIRSDVRPLDGASWTVKLQEAFANMRAKGDFVDGAEAEFKLGGWHPATPIRSSREWAATAWFNISHVSDVRDETTLVMYSLFSLVHNGEFEIFETFRDLAARYGEWIRENHISRIQLDAAKPLLYAATHRELGEEERETILDALEIIGDRQFEHDTARREMMDDLAVRLSYEGPAGDSQTEASAREARVGTYLSERRGRREDHDRSAYRHAREVRNDRLLSRTPRHFAAYRKIRTLIGARAAVAR